MKSSASWAFVVGLLCASSSARAEGSAAQPLPALPAQGAAAAPAAQAAPSASPASLTPQQLYERIRRGVAVLEKHGVPVAIGTVLGNDGRILTALSGVGGLEGVDVHYADGTTVHAELGQIDRATDLALLVPQGAKRTDGLRASEVDPTATVLRAMLPARGGHLGPAEAGVKGRVDAHAQDGEPLSQMLDVDVKGPLIAGAPLLDSAGSVVAVLVRACRGPGDGAQRGDPSTADAWSAAGPAAGVASASCNPAVLGATIPAIRSFLSKTLPPTTTPTAVPAPAPWLGIRGESAVVAGAHGVRVVAVAPQSPAEQAGLKPNADVIEAVDGQPIDSPEKLADSIAKHTPGDAVRLLVYGGDKFREVSVALRAAP